MFIQSELSSSRSRTDRGPKYRSGSPAGTRSRTLRCGIFHFSLSNNIL